MIKSCLLEGTTSSPCSMATTVALSGATNCARLPAGWEVLAGLFHESRRRVNACLVTLTARKPD